MHAIQEQDAPDQLPLVSVIVPARNMSRYLPAAIAKDPRVHCHHTLSGGMSAARNLGIRASRGSVIALCDADDWWAPNTLSLQLRCLREDPDVGVVCTGFTVVSEPGQPLRWFHPMPRDGWITEALFLSNVVSGSTSIIRRRHLDMVGLCDESLALAEDYDLWLRLSTCCAFRFLNGATYFYRQWWGQSTRNEIALVESTISVRRNFLLKHPLLVCRAVQQEAWSRLLVERGLAKMRAGRGRCVAIADIARGLRFQPGYVKGWRAIAKVLIGRV